MRRTNYDILVTIIVSFGIVVNLFLEVANPPKRVWLFWVTRH